jgi:methylated-DNA-[protein]-cysteine S-methyltransferase
MVARYFEGELGALGELPLDARGTAFQQSVWEALRHIPIGETRSYGELARALGNPRAVRAVARANALNPIALAIPCHRVIGSDGELTGYAGGLPRKKWLLEHEQRFSRAAPSRPGARVASPSLP